jgi:purine-nucleoside phosphorylase
LAELLKTGSAEALRDDAVVLDVEIAKQSADTDRHHQKNDQRSANHGIARQDAELPLPAFAVPSSGF